MVTTGKLLGVGTWPSTAYDWRESSVHKVQVGGPLISYPPAPLHCTNLISFPQY